MSTTAYATPEQEALEAALFEAKRILVGQDRMLERLFVCWLANGHVLLEGAPGLAKTLAAETMATILGGSFNRIQFTPDLVPADLVGTRVYKPSQEAFDVELGPVCSPTRSTAPPPRCSPLCSRSWPSATCRSAG